MIVHSQPIHAQSSALPMIETSLQASLEICRRHRQSRIATRAAPSYIAPSDGPKRRMFRFSLRDLLC